MSNQRKQRRRAERETALRANAETANALAQLAIAGIQKSNAPPDQQSQTNKNDGWVFLGMTAGQWISAGGILGCNIVVNRISPNTFSMYFAISTIALWVCWITWKTRWQWRSIVWAVCFFAFFGTHKYIQFEIKNSPTEPEYSGDILPANDPSSSIPPYMPTNDVVLLLGKSMSVTHTFPHTVVMWRGAPALVISTNSRGISVSAKFFDENGNIVADLENNHFNINRLNSFMLERPDKSTLRVRDQQDVTVLDIRFVNSKLIKLQGLLRFPGVSPVIINENSGPFSSDNYYGENYVADVVLW